MGLLFWWCNLHWVTTVVKEKKFWRLNVNKKRNENQLLIIVIALFISIIGGCQKNTVITDDPVIEKPVYKPFSYDDINPELKDTIYFALEYIEEDAILPRLVAVKNNGEIVTIVKNSPEFAQKNNTASYGNGMIYFFNGYSVHKISLREGNGNYNQEKLFDLNKSMWLNYLAVCGDYLFYSYDQKSGKSVHNDVDILYRNYIGRYNLITQENDPVFLDIGFHEIVGLAGLGNDQLAYTESYGMKNTVKILNIATNEEKTITKYGNIAFSFNDKLLYKEIGLYKTVAYYEYSENNFHVIDDQINTWMEGDPNILPYKNGYLYVKGVSVYFHNGIKNTKLLTISEKKYDYIDALELISQNILKIYIFYHMDGHDGNTIIKYDLNTNKIKVLDLEDDNIADIYNNMYLPFYYVPIVYDENMTITEN